MGLLDILSAPISYEYNSQLMEEQGLSQKSLQSHNYDLQKKFYTQFQSPAAMLQQYKDAGLSPSLMTNFSGGSGTSGGVGSAAISNQSFGVGDPLDAAIKLAQVRNINADTNLKDTQSDETSANTKLLGAEYNNSIATLDKIISETQNNRSLKALNDAKTSLTNLQVYVSDLTKDTQVAITNKTYDKLEYETEIAFENLRQAYLQSNMAEETYNDLVYQFRQQSFLNAAELELRKLGLAKMGIEIHDIIFNEIQTLRSLGIDQQNANSRSEEVKLEAEKVANSLGLGITDEAVDIITDILIIGTFLGSKNPAVITGYFGKAATKGSRISEFLKKIFMRR